MLSQPDRSNRKNYYPSTAQVLNGLQTEHLLSPLLEWFAQEWAFPQVAFTAHQLETHQRQFYAQAGSEHPTISVKQTTGYTSNPKTNWSYSFKNLHRFELRP
jgi:hypothetical protein